MKRTHSLKIIVLFAVLVACSGVAQGQHRITEAMYPSPVRHTIVREYTFPATVSYVETASDHSCLC